jgi:hypothetical protein
VDATVTASKSTTLEGSSTVGTQAGEKAGMVRGVTTENGLQDTNNLGCSTSQKISDESESPAFGGNICRISESGACQTGKQNEGRTHVQ